MRKEFASVGLLVSLGAAALAACSSDGAGSASAQGRGHGGAAASDAGGLFDTGANVDPNGLVVEASAATIDVVDGVSSSVTLTAKLTYPDSPAHVEVVKNVAWSVDRPSLAAIDAAASTLAGTGARGGAVVVTGSYQGLTGTANVAIRVKTTLDASQPVVPDADRATLEGATSPDPSIVWAYPYDGTVFPQGIAAPELMWNGGADGDVYEVRLGNAYAEMRQFVRMSGAPRVTLDETAYRTVVESGGGGPVELHVTRLSGGVATSIAAHTWKMASAALRGTVYYWANNSGRIVRIKPGATAPEDFLAAHGIADNCSTCHAVSANGSKLVIGGDTATTTYDLRNDATILTGKGREWAMPAISATGSVLVENNAGLPGPPGGRDGAFDADTGAQLAGTGLEGVMLDMPAFAPDDALLAYVTHGVGALSSRSWDAANRVAGGETQLVQPAGDQIGFPTVSPDHGWIVYHRGDTLDTRYGTANLYLASSSQPGVEMRLAALDGDGYGFAAGDRDRNFNYEPTFAPIAAGGYFWVVFTSRRTYGNRLTGGKDAVKQLWVAAIDQSPTPGVDPSHPAFALPGQALDTLNMRAFWALDPCKQDGASCGSGTECCGGYCESGDGGAPVCGVPPANTCSQAGDHCEGDDDCCGKPQGFRCINHFCTEPGPG